MGRTLGERTKKERERDFGSCKLFFFFPRFYRPSWVQLERLLRGPRPVTDRFPAPRSSTHTPSSIMPQHPPSPPSDCVSTHSVGTDTDPGIYACYTVMMVNRPILDRYNEDGSGPAKVADSTRTHMAAGQWIAKLHPHAHVTRTHSHTHTHIHSSLQDKERARERKKKKREEGKGKKGGAKRGKKKEQKERGRRRERKKKPPEGEEGVDCSDRATLLCIIYIYIYVICMCVEGGDCSVRERS